tara:strand:- start:157 stop:687 length:531 start_codon:yes stop_codon:yes gene_type:complete
MKKNKTLIVFLLLQLLFIGSAQAKCDLESFRFGTSYKALVGKLKLDKDLIMPKIDGQYEQLASVAGEELCKNEKVFEFASVDFLVLYDKLVEIRVMSFSEKPSLVDWAESIYGKMQKKPTSFYDAQPNAEWIWDNPNATISYSVLSDTNSVVESIIIQSAKHAKYFSRLAKEQEGE